MSTEILTFLFTDIEGSTSLWEQYPETMHIALAHHDALLRSAIESHHGHVFKTLGDAFCAAFPTAHDALAAAFEAQRALQTGPAPVEPVLRVRMALHAGPVEQRDNDYFGPVLNRTSRIMGVGHGGQILLSELVMERVRAQLPQGMSLLDLGHHRLRDLQTPEHLFQPAHLDLLTDFPPLRSLSALPNNLPFQSTRLIGREKELETLQNLLSRAHLVTLTGVGGTGKTRLALQAAAELPERSGDGVWLIELAPLADPALLPLCMMGVLGLREEQGRSPLQVLASYLKSRDMLLILDNCEHLVEACALLVNQLIRTCPQVHWLATSREPLGIAGEQIFRVPSLHTPSPKETGLATLAESEAVQLFVERAALIQPAFTLTEANAQTLADICRKLDGIPLAIELAAARAKVLSVEQILSKLRDRFRLLTGGSRVALERHQTLQAVVDWSYDLLNEQEQHLFYGLSVFAGGFTLEAAVAVCGEGWDEWETLDLLTHLIDKSLLTFEERGERYKMLETLRQYGQELLERRGERDTIRDRHLAYFLNLAGKVAPNPASAGQTGWFRLLAMEHDNLRVALDWASGHDSEAWLRLVNAMGYFWDMHGSWSEGRKLLECAMEEQSSTPETVRARASLLAGWAAFRQSDYEAAQNLSEACLALSRQLGDQKTSARALGTLGAVASHQGNYERAQSLFEESLAIYKETGDEQGAATALMNMGNIAFEQGNYAQAQNLYEETLAIRRKIHDERGTALILANLGILASIQGHYERAWSLCEESLAIYRAIGDKWGIAFVSIPMGDAAYGRNDYAQAQSLYAESLAICREAGDKGSIAVALNNLGNITRECNDHAEAQSLYQESLAIYREIGYKRGIPYSLRGLASLACEQADYMTSLKLLQESLAIDVEIGQKLSIAADLEELAKVAFGMGQPERAARLAGTAAALREVLGAPLPPFDRLSYENVLSRVRASLGNETFDAAFAGGRTMCLEDVIHDALDHTD
jgi:predicted ATPase/class 3 adenylate cyclase/Tfp pilus assembly protein PilF